MSKYATARIPSKYEEMNHLKCLEKYHYLNLVKRIFEYVLETIHAEVYYRE